MKFCTNCGNQVHDNAVVCLKCGSAIQPLVKVEEVNPTINPLFVIFSFLSPLFGFIYWPVKAKTRPNCALCCGIVSIITFVLSLIYYLSNPSYLRFLRYLF